MPYLDKLLTPITETQARHLLRRTTFGPTQNTIERVVRQGLDKTIEELFLTRALPSPPVKDIPDGTGSRSLNDPGAKYGETWVNADPFPNVNPPMLRNRVLRSRSKSLYAWTFLQMQYAEISLREKMHLFWHNHFVVGNAIIPHREYLYQDLLRRHALGNVIELTKAITIDTSMLIYLSGTENTNLAPNENYSRELLELFTVGKGNLVAPGDYSNYTEDDVVEMAKVLTGWRVRQVSDPNTLTAEFVANRHTPGSKVLSHRFANSVIEENGADEYIDLIDIIFRQDECSRFITRKLYRWFVNSEIDEDIEEHIIEPLAEVMRSNNYEVAPSLKILFSSEHFFESTACMIKSPIDLIFSASKALGIQPPSNEVEDEYSHVYNYYVMCAELEQALYFHPDVAGWKAYYQEPQFYKTWINNLLLPKRHEYAKLMIEGGTAQINDENYGIVETVPVLDLVANIPGAEDPNLLIDTLASRLFNSTITDGQRQALKEILIPGLPDFEWTVEYTDYLSEPNDDILKLSITQKLVSILSVMVRMSEFQVM